MATVTLCPDSKCVTMDSQHKLKTDRFFLGPFQPIEEFWTSERAKQVVQQDGGCASVCPGGTPDNSTLFSSGSAEWVCASVCPSGTPDNNPLFSSGSAEWVCATVCFRRVQECPTGRICGVKTRNTARLTIQVSSDVFFSRYNFFLLLTKHVL